MAYDSLKALIRQYIKTNGEQEITGQILQNVLVEMVNQYPSTDGFATQSWVTSQGYITASALSGYATQSWVTTQLGSYLPLTGGTLTGALNIDKDASSIILNFGGIELAQSGSDFKIYANHDFITNKDSLIITNLVENTIGTIDIRHNNLSVDNSVTATSFVKSGGTSAQFLKADGSVDSNAYLPKQGSSFYFITDADMPETAANISTLNAAHRMTLYRNAILMPYQADNANDGGFIRSRGTSESSAIFEIGMWDDAGEGETIQFNYYPTTSTINPTYSISVPKKTGTIALTSDLASYLPLSGGTITGNLTVDGSVNFNNNLTFANDRGINFGTDNGIRIKRDGYRLLIVNEASDDIIIGDYNNSNSTSIVNDLQGCTANSAYIVGSPTWFIRNDGTAQFRSVSQTSDLRKKTITGDVPMNLYNVANAPLFKFTWKDEKKYSGQHIGSAAQYWQTVLPELVIIGSDTEQTLAMQYDVIALASAITVAKTVVNHEERIILLERENEALKKEIADLKSA